MIEEVIRLSDYFRKSRPYIEGRLLLLQKLAPKKKHRLAQATTISIALVAGSALIAFPVQALFRTNTVALVHNSISIVSPTQCSTNSNNTTVTVNGNGNSTNNVNVNNSNSQSASTGNTTVTGNTNGGSATSGNASNTNCTNININIH